MFVLANILNGLAAETELPAVVEDLFAAPLPADANAPSKLVPQLEVRSYLIEGNTFLSPAQFSVLSNYTGTVDFSRLQTGLDKLQAIYRDAGLSNVSVALPEQTFTNGVVQVKVVEQHALPDYDLAAAITNLFLSPENKRMRFEVRGYQIEGNTVLPAAQFSFLTNYYTGELDFDTLREGLGRIQLRYRELGFPTISVTLPQQRLTNGIVRVRVIEGRIVNIVVTGNHYYSTANIRRALPSLTTNIFINTKWFQPELDRANLNQDRQIYPVISPGPDPGTTELELKVKDRLPLHGHLEVNNKSTPDTPLLRMDAAMQYGNLCQLDHQVGVDYNFSPGTYKNGDDVRFYDDPMVASYSGYYRLPLGYNHSERETYNDLPVDFGYDEVTRKFSLPAATGRPDLIIYGSRSVSDTPISTIPGADVFSNELVTIGQQFQQHSFTINDGAGAKLTYPLSEFAGIKSSLLLGFDYKSYEQQSSVTNQYLFNLFALDNFGNRTFVTNQIVGLPVNGNASIYYLPLSVGWVAARPDPFGGFAFNYNQNIFLSPLASSREGFEGVASSRSAGGNYTTLTAGLTRYQNLPLGWSASLKADGQWASESLINNEQFGLGGTAGVRGYQDGEAYGDEGWRVMFDLKAPPVNVGYLPTATGTIPAELRCSWFMDYGEIYFVDRPTILWPAVKEWGTGTSFYLTMGEHFDARLTLAWALENVSVVDGAAAGYSLAHTSAGDLAAYFSVSCQF